MGDAGTAGKQGGFVEQELVTAGKRRLDQQVICHEIEKLQQDLAAQEFRVLTDVRTSFFKVLVAQRRLNVTEQLVKLSDDGLRAVNQLLEAQFVSRIDLLRARVQSNSTKLLLQDAQNRHQAAWRELASAVGISNMTPEPLAGDIETVGPPLDWDAVLQQLLTSSPELAAAMNDVERARWSVERARAGRLPNVTTIASVHKDNASGDTIAGFGLGMPLPIFDRNQGNIQKAQADVAGAHRNVERVRLALENRLAEVYRQHITSSQQVERYRKEIIPDAKEALALATEGYQGQEFGYLDLLAAQRVFFESSLSYLDALLNLQVTRARIDGYLLDQGLAEQ
jgi:cobalt-zinc-cadmium efflux system outer membrane protein